MPIEYKINHLAPSREILDLEYQIPFTSFDLSQCSLRWWPELFGESRNWTEYQKLWQQRIQDIIKTDGCVLDIGAGNSSSMVELNQMIREAGGKPKGVRVDLQYGAKKGEIPSFPYRFKITPDLSDRAKKDKDLIPILQSCSRAVGGDAFQLPLKNNIAQLVLSNELLPYLMKDRESDTFKKFLLRRHLSWTRIEIQKRMEQEPNNPQWRGLSEAISKELAKPSFQEEDSLFYDLELLAQFFQEVSRVLKPNFSSPAEARISPFSLGFLFDFRKNRDFNRVRMLQFLKIIRDNFKDVSFYNQAALYRGEDLSRLTTGSSFFSQDFDRQIRKQRLKATKNFEQIFGAQNIGIEPGVLVLKK